MTTNKNESENAPITAHVCGAKLCRDGKPHDNDAWRAWRDIVENGRGVTAVCSRCGVSSIDRDLLDLP